MLTEIRELIRESIIKWILEANIKNHATDRLNERMTIAGLSYIDKNIIMKCIPILISKNFPKNISYAIRVADLHVGPENVNKTIDGKYFRFIDGQGQDSTGNQVWAIIRHNEIITIFLRKDYQTENIKFNREKLQVDKIVMNFNNIDSIIQNSNKISKIKVWKAL